MSIFRKLFGSPKAAPEPNKTLDYKGYVIAAAPFKTNSGWQLAGNVSKGERTHKFVRADQFTSREEAEDFTLSKGQLIVDQLGDSVFNP